MKKTTLFFLVVMIMIASCNKIAELITFHINTQANITVNSSTLLNTPFEIRTPGITTQSSETFENNRTAPDLIKKVAFDEIKLTITNPANKTFSFLKNVHIYISTDDYDEVELAYLDNIPADAQSIKLNTSGENLEKFVKSSSYRLRTTMETRETLTQSTDIQVDMRFAVTAGLK
jgi:hypothetical protein